MYTHEYMHEYVYETCTIYMIKIQTTGKNTCNTDGKTRAYLIPTSPSISKIIKEKVKQFSKMWFVIVSLLWKRNSNRVLSTVPGAE